MEKVIPGFSHQYGLLSEYAHPNWAGTSYLYSKIDKERAIADFGHNLRGSDGTKLIGAGNLSVALRIFERSYNRIADLVPAFVELCENRL